MEQATYISFGKRLGVRVAHLLRELSPKQREISRKKRLAVDVGGFTLFYEEL